MSRAGFKYQQSFPYSKKMSVKSENMYIPTNPMPAINEYNFRVHDVHISNSGKDKSHVVPRQEFSGAYDRVVLKDFHFGVTKSVLQKAISRGNQQGFKTRLSGPTLPFVTGDPKITTDTPLGVFERYEKPTSTPKLQAPSIGKYNEIGATYAGGINPVAPDLGETVDAQHKQGLIGYGSQMFTDSKNTGGGNKGGRQFGLSGKLPTRK